MAKKVVVANSPSVIHEYDKSAIQHRIVVVANGVPEVSDWFPVDVVATLGNLRASTGMVRNIPSGVFRVTSVASQDIFC